MKNKAILLTFLLAPAVLAQTADTSRRLVKVQGAPIGDPVKGPLTFRGNPVKGTISTLQIQAGQAVLTPPAGATIPEARGKMRADFTGGVTVTRGRLTAKGTQLAYSEATGQGVLSGKPSATFQPEQKDSGDPVNIQAEQMSLDVDNNVSTSTGNVQLTNGNQSGKADKLIFDEDRELAQLLGTPTLTRAAKGAQKELNITGQEVRVLTKAKTLYVKGNVKLVQGSITTTGNAVYYDDKKDLAYVVGNAVSVDSKTNVKITAPASGYIEQNTALGRVLRKNSAYTIPEAQFKFKGEK